MPTPSELVTESFANAQSYASTAQGQLATFTTALNAAVQATPMVSVTWTPVADPGTATVPDYVAPASYSSALLTTTTANLTTRLAGGTGISASAEAAIWDRSRERELALAQANIDQVTRDVEAMGWALPPGILVEGIRREQRAYYDKASGLSRDIAIKQAELEQANAQKTIDQVITLEQGLGQINYQRSETSLNAYRAAIEGFKAGVEQDVKHWETQIKQYEATQTYTFSALKLNAEIARANTSAALDAAKVGAQVYAQLTASAYSLIHASASVSAGASNSVSWSYSNDTATAPASVTSV
jgi:hypothetical protein